MNNEEKIREIVDIYMPDTGFTREDLYYAAMEMAQWKDEQYNSTELNGFIDIIAVKLLYFMSKNNYSANDKNWDKIRKGFLDYIKNQ